MNKIVETYLLIEDKVTLCQDILQIQSFQNSQDILILLVDHLINIVKEFKKRVV